ncbi:MAG: protein BatD [Paludibacteraceae bacterium]|nr:protein BatD [Paludibacteraceae bacterium]
MKKRFFTWLTILLSIAPVGAVDFRAVGPSQVPVNQSFQIQYIVDEKCNDIQIPSMPGFELLAGPFTSTASSFSFVNGKRTSTYQKTFTYTYSATKEGTYTIGAATVDIKGRKYRSNGLKITVVREQEPQAATTSSRTNDDSSRPQRTQTAQSAPSIFMRTEVNKTHAHEQEPVTLCYNLYFVGVNDVQLAGVTKMPDFDGFLKQESDLEQLESHVETYNGRQYNVAVVYKNQLYPQHSGDITITPAHFEVVYTTPGAERDPFGQMFGYQEHKTLKAPAVTIHVDALPQEDRPKSFSGGVGHFTMIPSISSTELNTNEPITLKLDISGSGNMKLIKTPDVKWPEGFESYDPKVSNSYQTTDSGMSGTKSIEYMAIPREPGDYTLPPVTLTYYDSEAGAYKTLTTPSYQLHINRGQQRKDTEVSDYSQEDIKQLATDVRYIHTNDLPALEPNSAMPPAIQVGSFGWWLCYLIPLIIAIIVLIAMRRYIQANADLTQVRYRKANKVAQKRLRNAKKLMDENQTGAFYEEIERAAMSYLSDRLTIPTAELNKETISQILAQKNVPEPLIKETEQVLSTAEFARYAPSMSQDMNTLYSRTVELINQLEEQKL